MGDELSYAEELLADGRGAVGYLLQDRVTDIDEFLDALGRVAGERRCPECNLFE